VKVVLRADVDHLGRKGDVVEVADGYARNFLVPRGLALRADKGVLRQAEAMRRSREARDARERAAAEELAARLGAAVVTIAARAGEGGRLFGSVTAADIAEHLEPLLGHPVDRRRIELPEPVKQLGEVTVEVRLHPEVRVSLTVEVVPA
jgi:large subunit ribosomal protein L9